MTCMFLQLVLLLPFVSHYSIQAEEPSSKMPTRFNDTRGVFYQKYQEWMQYRRSPEVQWMSHWNSHDLQLAQNIIDLGLPAVPIILEAMRNEYDTDHYSHELGYVLEEITRVQFHNSPSLKFAYPTADAVLWEMWYRHSKKYTETEFSILIASRRGFDHQKNPELLAEVDRRITNIGVFVLPYLIEEISKGEVGLIAIVSELSNEAIPATASAAECLTWWEQNKIRFAKPNNQSHFDTFRNWTNEHEATGSKEFSDEAVRELLYTVCLAEDGLFEDYHVAIRKLTDLGESIFPLLAEEALRPHEAKWGMEMTGRIAANIISFFDRSEASDTTEARRTTLKVFEKFPSQYIMACRVMGNIGEPEDVPKLLPFMNEDCTAFINVIRAVGKIAAVSQIPEIEAAVANWKKKHYDPGLRKEEWQNKYLSEVEKILANIRERNVQWTPSSVEHHLVAEQNVTESHPAPSRVSTVVSVVVSVTILVLLALGVFLAVRRWWIS